MKRNPKFGLMLYFALCLVLVPVEAFAYIDPSVSTFLIQAVVGVAVAMAAGVAVYWRKAKKKAMEKLGIDENAHKEVESDTIEVNDKKEGQ